MLKVIGLGNQLRGDDSVGPVVVEALRQQELPVPLTLVDAGSDAFTLLEHMSAADPMLIIDCARMGKAPGEIALFTLDERVAQDMDRAISLHGFGFGEVYAMARALGPVPASKIIGVEPVSVAFGEPLSAEVSRTVPEIIKMVIEEAQKYAE